MGINRRPTRLTEPHQRKITPFSDVNRERGGSRNRKQNFHTAHRRLLHHFVTRTTGNQRRALPPFLTFRSAAAEQFIQRNVASDIFMAPASSPDGMTHAAACVHPVSLPVG